MIITHQKIGRESRWRPESAAAGSGGEIKKYVIFNRYSIERVTCVTIQHIVSLVNFNRWTNRMISRDILISFQHIVVLLYKLCHFNPKKLELKPNDPKDLKTDL